MKYYNVCPLLLDNKGHVIIKSSETKNLFYKLQYFVFEKKTGKQLYEMYDYGTISYPLTVTDPILSPNIYSKNINN